MHVGNDGNGSQDFELNLAPIIDCFTVLITYLLVSASFISLGILDVGVSAVKDGGDGPVSAEVPMNVVLQMEAHGKMQIKATGGAPAVNISVTVPANGEKGNWNMMSAELRKLKERLPQLKEISVYAASDVQYQELVKAIEKIKGEIPKVYLANGDL